MSRTNKMQSIVEEAVSEAFEAAIPKLRAEIISRAVEELQALEPVAGSLPTDLLNAAASSIQESSSQAEILRHLLEGSARFCGRAALFVLKAGALNGWQGTGFDNNEAVKSFNLGASAGLAGEAVQNRAPVVGTASKFDGGFINTVGSPADGNCVVLPLLVKEKVAAVIYADAGKLPDISVDVSALTLLCRFAALWLELTALRKAGVSAPAEEAQVQTATAAATHAGSSSGGGTVAVVEEDIHRKARRFAKLLVDEIKLYNQSKVSEGRQNRDLYERLKEDIEKSRSAYEQRFGETAAASANYFTQELVRVLADNDVSLMGGSFPR
jgi:hypothetical protein